MIIQSNYSWNEKIEMLIISGTSIHGTKLRDHLKTKGVLSFDSELRIEIVRLDNRTDMWTPRYQTKKNQKHMAKGPKRNPKEEKKWIKYKRVLAEKQNKALEVHFIIQKEINRLPQP
uniref:Transposase n=1 Tax=Caenorhabditis tropicalis TaxID=1561998 RepID=A0A1I7T9R9_9PELO